MRTALSLGATKDAALYFDHVVPLALLDDFRADALASDQAADIDFDEAKVMRSLAREACAPIHSLLPEAMQDGDDLKLWLRAALDSETAWTVFLDALLSGDRRRAKAAKRDLVAVYGGPMRELFSKHRLRGLPMVSQSSRVTAGEDDSVLVTIQSLNLIDVRRASWDQVIEFRQDPDSVAQLRRLRLFAIENYGNRDKMFIEDDLLSRIDAYESQARKWGFETTHAALSMLLNSRLIAGGVGASLLAALFGSPVAGVATAVGALTVEIGRVALEVAQRKVALNSAQGENPVSYLVRAQKALTER